MSRRIFSYFTNQKLSLSVSVVSAVLTSVLQLSLPYFMGIIIDFIAGKGKVNFSGMIKYSVIMGTAIILAVFFQWLTTQFANKMAYQIGSDIRKEYMRKMNTLPVSFYDKMPHGDLVSRITNDVECISEGIHEATSHLFMGVATIIGSFILMLSLNWAITLLVVALTPLAFLISSFIVKNIDKTFRMQQKTVGEINAFAKESLDGEKLIRAYSLENSMDEEFGKINKKLYKYGQKSQFFSSLVNPSTRLVNSTTYIAVGVLSGVLAATHSGVGGKTMTIGLMASFLAYALQFAKPINDITNVTSQVQASVASFRRIFEVLDEESMPQQSKNTPVAANVEGNIEFKNVDFSYVAGRPIIKNVSLKIKSGSKVAVVGPTGAGKTTLVNLLMRFYDIDSGSIFLDGKDTKSVTKDSLRTSFAMVLQDTFLFNDTVGNNISYGRPDASPAEIEAAARGAYAHNFIKRLPQGYDTVISLNGDELSNGQKQLLTIARAMLVNPPMLILDEATSSVDTLTEIRIQRAFEKMMKGKTTFVIAHRLSTIVDSDLILVMNKGNIQEVGTHSELLKLGGLYSKLYNSQFEK